MLVVGVAILLQTQAQGVLPHDLAKATLDWVHDGRAVAITAGYAFGERSGISFTGRHRIGGTTPISAQTIYEIGSITKAITGTLLADMVRRGEVALDDPIAQHLPADWKVAQVGERAITLLDLATHTSGLPRMPPGLMPPDMENPYATVDATMLREMLAGLTPTRGPGERYEYSNLGYALLGQALAHAGGQSWETLVRERVLEPLGMKETWAEVPAAKQALFATGHTSRFLPVPHWDFEAFAAAGALRASGLDMHRLGDALRNPADTGILASLHFASEGRRSVGAGQDSVGLGWHVMHRGEARIVWHNGGTGGFRTWVGADRGANRSAFILANAVLPWVDAVGVAALLGDSLPEAPKVEPITTVSVTAAQLAPLVGRYALNPAFVMEITHRGDTLYLQATNQPKVRMVATSPSDFAATVVDASITFERNEAGDITALILHQGGIDQRAPRQP